MNRCATLLRTPAVVLRRFDHPPGDAHVDPEREVSGSHSVSIVEAGAFDLAMDGGRWRFSPGTLFVARKGMEYACSHDDEEPSDRCLSVSFADRTVDDLRSADLPALRPPFAHLSARRNYLRHRLATCVPGDEVRLELLAGALFESLGTADVPRPVRAAGRTTELMRRIDRAVELVEADYARTLTLEDLAGAAGLSPFHFARVFRELVGMPPHRWLTAVRLRHAARLLAAGESVTRTCYDVGFGSLSHFVTAFRKRFGVSPSQVKRGAELPTLHASLSRPVWSRAFAAGA